MPEVSRKVADDVRQRLLVLRCQAGDERAFRELYEAFSARTLRYVRGLLGDMDADDVQQEVWLTVYRRIRGLADPANFRTWLFATTRNRAIDWLRKRKRDAELFEIAGAEYEEAASPAPAEPDEWDPTWFRQSLALLPVVQREAILLRYRDDLSYAEIAVVTGCAIGTVRSRLHNARRALRNMHHATQSTESLEPDETREIP